MTASPEMLTQHMLERVNRARHAIGRRANATRPRSRLASAPPPTASGRSQVSHPWSRSRAFWTSSTF